MDLKIKNKIVLVAGSSRGIGYGIAEGFLKESSKVIITGRDKDNLNKAFNILSSKYNLDNIYKFNCDFNNALSVKKLYSFLNENFEGIDVLINNVGTGTSVPDAIPDDKAWKHSWDINFEASLMATRVLYPLLEKNKNSSILFISSIAAKEAFGAPVAYSTAKTALNAFAKNLARKVALKVRVNVLAPGNVFFENGSWDKKMSENPSEVKKLIKQTVPMNRFASLEEIANSAIFLSSEVSSFTTGSVLVVDGGQTVSIF